MNVLSSVISNGFIPLLPVLAWNIAFASKLPAAFGPKDFDQGIPKPVLTGESVFRAVVFLMPLLIRLDLRTPEGMAGLFVYIAGSVLYYLSWLLLMYLPNTRWSRSVFGFTAPAYTPLIWLAGIGLMARKYYFSDNFSAWQYLVPAVAFTAFHFSHTLLAFRITRKLPGERTASLKNKRGLK